MNKIGTQRIETERLILRRFTTKDARDMFENWASDPEVTAFLTWETHKTVEDSKRILSLWIPEYEKGDFFNWAMEEKESGAVIGNISVVKTDEQVGSAEMGYCMGRAYWGKELMPEALRAAMDFLFDRVGCDRVCAKHDARNPKSGRVMQKAGMRFEGVLRQAGKSNAGICDEVVYAMLRTDRKQ